MDDDKKPKVENLPAVAKPPEVFEWVDKFKYFEPAKGANAEWIRSTAELDRIRAAFETVERNQRERANREIARMRARAGVRPWDSCDCDECRAIREAEQGALSRFSHLPLVIAMLCEECDGRMRGPGMDFMVSTDTWVAVLNEVGSNRLWYEPGGGNRPLVKIEMWDAGPPSAMITVWDRRGNYELYQFAEDPGLADDIWWIADGK